MNKIKEKVLKEAKKCANYRYPFDKWWCEVGIDLTLAEVGKKIEKLKIESQGIYSMKKKFGYCDSFFMLPYEELKKELGIK